MSDPWRQTMSVLRLPLPDIYRLFQQIVALFPLILDPRGESVKSGGSARVVRITCVDTMTGCVFLTDTGLKLRGTCYPRRINLSGYFLRLMMRVATRESLNWQITQLLTGCGICDRDDRDDLLGQLIDNANDLLGWLRESIGDDHRIRVCEAILEVCDKMIPKSSEPPSDERGGVLAPVNGPPPVPDEIMSNP